MELRDVLKAMRVELGINQSELANALHVSFATVNRWEAGKTSPNRSILAVLIEFANSRGLSRECTENLKKAITGAKRAKIAPSRDSLYTVEHSSLSQLIDEASFPIYVSDAETDELLYLNHKAEKMLGGTLDDLESTKCYKSLMHRDTPCPFCRREELSSDSFTTFQAFRPGENTYHLVQAKLTQWNGRRAQVRYIIDIGGSLSVSAKRSRETSYAEQLSLRRELAGSALATAHYNLTRDTVSDVVSSREDLAKLISDHSIDAVLRMIRENSFSDEEQEKLDTIRDRKAMIQQYYLGRTHISIRHYISRLAGYFEGSLDLMQNPVTYDIEAFVQLHDITASTMTKKIARRLFSVDYETILTIDAATGEAHPFSGSHIKDVIVQQETTGSSEAGVAEYLRKYCADEDVEGVVRGTSLPYVKQRLESSPYYHITYSLRQSGGIIYKRAVYTYLDDRKKVILCAMQNLTDLHAFENEKRGQLSAALQTLQEQSGMNVARYDLKSKRFYNNSEMATALGYGSVVENVPESFIEDGLIAPSFIEEYREFFAKLQEGVDGSIQVPCKVCDGSFHWLRIDARIIFDAGHIPGQAVMSFKDVDEACEQAAVYKKWRNSFDQKKPCDYTLFRCNLSKVSTSPKVEGTLLKIQFAPDPIPFNDRTREYASRFVHIDDFDAYTRLLNSENLLAGYYRGTRTEALDYRERTGEDEYRWIHLTVEMAQYPDVSDVEVFLMYELTDRDVSEERSRSSLRGSVFENTGVVAVKYDCRSGSFTYDPAISKYLLGNYDDRPIWEILMSDGVADTQDIKVMHDLISVLSENPERTSGTMELMMKTPSNALHWFNFYAIKQTDEAGRATSIILTFLDINDDVLTNKKLRFQAEHDSLTGLYNRSAFLKLAAESAQGAPAGSYVLMCSDVNDFRFFNNRYGREEGDRLLQYSAERLRAFVEAKGGIAGRLSADVFAFLLPNVPGVLERTEKVIRSFFDDYPLDAKITGRAGACVVSDPNQKADSILDMAETAKESIRGRFDAWLAVYDESMNEKRLREKYVTDRMETALAEGQFDVYLQPQFHHATGQIVGAEALVRWIDPERGVISPSEFIPVFEKNGFITRMDEYVWEKTAQYVSAWMAAGNEPVPVSVNVSREDLGDPCLCGKLIALIEKYSIPINIYRLEITESLFAADPKRLAAVVDELHKAGFLVEMDDFGSGYSSLNILKDVPVDILKLDMKFFSGEDNLGRGGMIINAVLRMSRWLGIPVIAEGVELKDQTDFLLSVGCPTIQGYLYEEPMPAKDFEKMLSGGNRLRSVPQNYIDTELDAHSFWNPLSVDSQIFNNYIGPAAVFEYHGGEYEIVRMNLRFAEAMQISETAEKFPDHYGISICEADRPKFKKAVLDVIYSCRDVKVGVLCALGNGSECFFRITLRVIAKSADRALIFAALDA